ncbi:MAG: LysM peptidoglycan-binding domain-containing protein [Bacteroidota bacterium]|nr:LysM peptidoglycan-binding domain-containing protein [Bacteroidota bacterium]
MSLLSQTKSINIQTIEGKKFYIHKIEKGQSLYSIAKLYTVSLEDIYKFNPETKSGTKTGQEVKIPFASLTTIVTPAVVATNTTVISSTSGVIDTNKFYCHKVTKGETLYAILRKYNKTEKELTQINPNFTSSIKEGQLIAINPKPVLVNPVKQSTAIVEPKKDSVIGKGTIKPKKSNYTVALILPFKLDQTLNLELNELVKNKVNFPQVPALAIDFYLGFKRCVDSLTTKDFEVNIELYDVDDRDSLKLIQIVNEPKFKQTDFIFGPLYANGFKIIAQKAKELGIPIVSPITQQNKMLYNNIYASKTNPSQFTLLESLADYCIDSLVNNNANIILMAPYEKDAKEVSYVKAFKKYYNDKQQQLGKTIKDTITTVRGLAGVKAAYKSGVKNIVVSLSNNQVFITDFTTQLAVYADKKDILLCGWQNTSIADNVDQEYLNQLHYTFPYQYNVVNTGNYSSIIEGYKTQVGISPSEYFFIGFDIALYYLNNLKQQDPNFIYNLNLLPSETNYLRFKFNRPDASTGFDNRGVYIFNYNNYQLYKTGWK